MFFLLLAMAIALLIYAITGYYCISVKARLTYVVLVFYTTYLWNYLSGHQPGIDATLRFPSLFGFSSCVLRVTTVLWPSGRVSTFTWLGLASAFSATPGLRF